jgi:regulator of sirC expression with transglutaminase-like and TPR domain
MITQKEVHALIALLGDEDEEVNEHVTERLLHLGDEALPLLEQELYTNEQAQYEKIDSLIRKIRSSSLVRSFESWKDSEDRDLLQGMILLNKIGYPDLDVQDLTQTIHELKLKVWLELHYDLTSFEKVKIINHILFHVFQLKPNTSFYHHPDNSYLNKVLVSKTGNPITLSILYMIIAGMLDIPVRGVNVPQHFMLAYVESDPEHQSSDTEVLFYINAFNNGAVYSHAHIRQYIESLGLKPNDEFMEPCDNLEILKRCCRNLIYSYELLQNKEKVEELTGVLKTLEA